MFDILTLTWTWNQAIEIGVSGMITALVIMTFMVLLMRGLQIVSTRIENGKVLEPVETGGLPDKNIVATDNKKAAGPDRKVVAAITAAVTSYLEERAPSFKAGRITVSRQPQTTSFKSGWHLAGRKKMLEGRNELERIRRNKNRENI